MDDGIYSVSKFHLEVVRNLLQEWEKKLFSCLLPVAVRLVNRRGVPSMVDMVHMVHGLAHGITIIGWLTCNRSPRVCASTLHRSTSLQLMICFN